MCATSGGGFALMTEALGAAAMMEMPVVCIDVQRAGPATGVPTKTEQGDLWQVLGAGQGDYPRIIVAPTTIRRLLQDRSRAVQPGRPLPVPGHHPVRPADLRRPLEHRPGRARFQRADRPRRDRSAQWHNGHANGTAAAHADGLTYKRYEITESGISPRAFPGTAGYVHVVATDEHDEDGGLISDEFTNPHKRQAMHEKRMRKMDGVLPRIGRPRCSGPPTPR